MNKKQILETFINKEVSEEEAIDFYKSKIYEKPEWSSLDLAYLQFNQERCIIPPNLFADAVEEILGFQVLRYSFVIVPEYKEEINRLYKNKGSKPNKNLNINQDLINIIKIRNEAYQDPSSIILVETN